MSYVQVNAAFGRPCIIGHRCCVEIKLLKGVKTACALSVRRFTREMDFLGDLNKWRTSERVSGFPEQTARGGIEATVVSGDIIASTLGSWDTI